MALENEDKPTSSSPATTVPPLSLPPAPHDFMQKFRLYETQSVAWDIYKFWTN
ncbi:hypothetical protein CsSME_00000875 [Camellia sinensis var. sinensis]